MNLVKSSAVVKSPEWPAIPPYLNANLSCVYPLMIFFLRSKFKMKVTGIELSRGSICKISLSWIEKSVGDSCKDSILKEILIEGFFGDFLDDFG